MKGQGGRREGSENISFILAGRINAKWKATEGYRYPCGTHDSADHSGVVEATHTLRNFCDLRNMIQAFVLPGSFLRRVGLQMLQSQMCPPPPPAGGS